MRLCWRKILLIFHLYTIYFIDQSRLEKTLEVYSNPYSEHIFVAAHRGSKEFDDEDRVLGKFNRKY